MKYTTDLTQATPQGREADVWAQVISDLRAAQADLPVSYAGNDLGRATKGAATTLLGKAYMQNKRWADAQTQFAQVIGANTYSLVPKYTDNFRHTSENNAESIFEVQFSDVNKGGNDATSSQGGQRSQFGGVPGFGFNDGEVHPWLVREFLQEPTTADTRDPRLAATVFYNRRDQTQFPTALASDADTLAYGVGFLTRYGRDARNRSRVYWRKYQTDYYRTFEDFDSPINQRVMRYADVLLLQAEALNEQNQTASAIPLINQVRQRVQLAPLSASAFTQASLRTQLMHERATELAGEGVCWFDLQRWGLLDNATDLTPLKSHDPDFNTFMLSKTHLLPLPQNDIDLSKLT